ncbi:MAG TPA: DUF4388 domain-containing protein, partial [Longimicrobium sp.]|nr:DUF4388 domain-containing protein [Longimicrobium sp.]
PGPELFDVPTAIPKLADVEEDDDPLAKTRDLEPKDGPLAAAKAPDLEPDDDPLARTAANFEPEDDPLAKTRYVLPSESDKILAGEARPVVPVQPEPTPAATTAERSTPPEAPREPVAAKPAEPAPSQAAEPASKAEPKAEPASPRAASEPAARSEPVLSGFAFGDRDKGRAKADAAPAKPAPAAGNEPAGGETGDLGSTSVPRLLTAYYQARHDGELKLRQGNVLKVVYFSKGQPIYAASNLASERFGRFCVRKGLLAQAKLDEVAKSAKEQNQRTAELLMKQNLLTPEQRKELLEEQVREIIWSTFGWTQGEYAFVPKRPPAAGLVKLSVFPGNLIMEGVQRTETLVSLRKKVPGHRRYMPTSDPPYELHEITLSGAQAMLLAYADGTKTVEDLLSLTELPEKDALATLVGLELLGLIQERREDNRSKRISFGL